MSKSDQLTTEAEGSVRGFANLVVAEPMVMGSAFTADHFNHSMWLDGRMSPIVMVDHFHMFERTFQEHPHAGISAVTLMFEDSPGRMRSIDSLGKLSEFGPGDLHWTQAGSGVTHNQFPFADGADRTLPIHALQIFVKLPENLEEGEAASYKVSADQMPHFERGGVFGRVVLGVMDGLASAGRSPQELLFLDMWTGDQPGRIDVPISASWNALTLSIFGDVSLVQDSGAVDPVPVGMARADHIGESACLSVAMAANSHVVVLSGRPDGRPVYSNGPFAYGSAQGLASAVARYQSGEFGRCPEMPGPDVIWSD